MKRRCPECRKLVEVRSDGTLRAHSSTWKNPPPGAPLCPGGAGIPWSAR